MTAVAIPTIVVPLSEGRPGEQIETITEERTDENGRRILVTRKILKKLVVHKVSREIASRRQWKKFGEAKDHPPGPNTKTTLIGEEVFLRLAQNKNWDIEEKADSIMKADKVKTITCRHCQGAHWTSKCPLKDMMSLMETSDSKSPSSVGLPDSFMRPSASPALSSSSSLGVTGTPTPGKYIPRSQRASQSGDSLSHDGRDDSLPTIRVTNLSENAQDSDLRDLFGPFGNVTRTFIAKDHVTGFCKGFAFVTFTTREAAALAIEKVHRYAYDNLILKVEWANPNKSSS